VAKNPENRRVTMTILPIRPFTECRFYASDLVRRPRQLPVGFGLDRADGTLYAPPD
jgi:hypothetical protein